MIPLAEESEPMRRSEVLSTIAPHLPEIRQRFQVDTLHLFGSAARDEMTEASDIDILVAYKGAPNSDDYFDLKFFLEDMLGRSVDLVTDKGLRAGFRQTVAGESILVT